MWKECTRDRYGEALSMLPPVLWISKGFLFGEAFDHRLCKVTGKVQPTYAAFVHYNDKFYEGDPLTKGEFWAFDVTTLPP